MNPQVQITLTSVATSAVMAAGAALVTSHILTADQLHALAVATAPLIVGVLMVVGALVVKALPHSTETKIALAADTGKVSQIVTTDDIANSPKFATNPIVVDHKTALESVPPVPGAH